MHDTPIERDAPLDLGSDLSLRYQFFTKASLAHPAKLHLGLLAWLVERYTNVGDTIADPMAGIGSTAYAAFQMRDVILREIEPRWLAFAHENAAQILRVAGLVAGRIEIGQADARQPWGFTADHIIFSPPYGLEVSRSATGRCMTPDKVQARLAKLPSYDKAWDRVLRNVPNDAGMLSGAQAAFLMHYGQHPAQLGHLRNERYWRAMTAVYTQAQMALRPGGKLILVIKDHVKKGQRICVADQTVTLCESLGFTLIARHARHVHPLSLWQRRRKERGEPIVEDEDVLVFQGGKR